MKTARKLEDKAALLARLEAWLTLESRGGSGYFPYHFVLWNTSTKQRKAFGDTVFDGEPYGFILVAEPNSDLHRYRVTQRWVYILGIDSQGKTQLVFPSVAQGNVGNRVPYDPLDDNVQMFPSEIPLGNPQQTNLLFTVSCPFGMDTYVLLTSSQPIPQPDIMNSEGVRTRGAGEGEQNPLASLLNTLRERTRSPKLPPVPTDWSIERVSIRSAPITEAKDLFQDKKSGKN